MKKILLLILSPLLLFGIVFAQQDADQKQVPPIPVVLDEAQKKVREIYIREQYRQYNSPAVPGSRILVPGSPDLKPEFAKLYEDLVGKALAQVKETLEECAEGTLQCKTIPMNREVVVIVAFGQDFNEMYKICYPKLAGDLAIGRFAFTYKNYCILQVPTNNPELEAFFNEVVHEPAHARYYLWLIEKYGDKAPEIIGKITDPNVHNPFVQEGIATLGEPAAAAKRKAYIEIAIKFVPNADNLPSIIEFLKRSEEVMNYKGFTDPAQLYAHAYAAMLFLFKEKGVTLQKITNFEIAVADCYKAYENDKDENKYNQCVNNALQKLLGKNYQNIDKEFEDWLEEMRKKLNK